MTLFMTGKKERSLKEPMYSGGNFLDFPITSGFDLISYSKFLESFIKNSQRVVSSQSIHNGFLSAYLVTSKLHDPRPAVDWQIFTDYKKFFAFVREQRKKSMMIYSLAFDEGSSFGVFLLKNDGTDQRVLKRVSSIRKYRENGFKITACAAQGKPFCVIMTEDAENYKGKIQTWFTGQEWRHAEKKKKEGLSSWENYHRYLLLTYIEKVSCSHDTDPTEAVLRLASWQHHWRTEKKRKNCERERGGRILSLCHLHRSQ